MELLTGEAKEAFLNYCQTQSNYTNNSNHLIKYENSERGEFLWYGTETDLLKEEKFLTALIIDFFDNQNLFINVKSKFGQRKQRERFTVVIKNYNSGFLYDTRQQATIAGIKKANEIFNSKF